MAEELKKRMESLQQERDRMAAEMFEERRRALEKVSISRLIEQVIQLYI